MRYTWGWMVMLGLACGPQVGDDDDGANDSGTITSGTITSGADDDGATAANTSVGTLTTADDDGQTADDTTAGVGACEEFISDPSIGPAVAIDVRHEGSAPVFFHPFGCGGSLAFEITAPDGQPVPYLIGECFPTICEQLLGLRDCTLACPDCASPVAGRIEPGASGQGGWSGAWLAELQMTNACAPGPNCETTCQRPDAAPPGRYQIAFTVYRTCTGTCTCDAPSEICSLWSFDEQLSDPVTFVASLDYPTQSSIEITITD